MKYLLLLIIALPCYAVDVVLGRMSDLTWTGTGTDRVASFAPANPDVTDGLVAYWPLSGNALDTISTNHGAVTDATNATVGGKACYAFNGSSSFIDFGVGAQMKPTNAVTVSIWIYPNALTANVRPFSDWHQSGLIDRWLFYVPDSTHVQFYLSNNSGGTVNLTATVSASEWVMLTGIYDGTNVYMYANGASVAAGQALTGYMNNTPAHSVRMGKQAETGGYLNGYLRQGRIYNRALTSNEIYQVWNATK